MAEVVRSAIVSIVNCGKGVYGHMPVFQTGVEGSIPSSRTRSFMKICAISDTHTHYDQVQIEECDVLIHAGDLNCYYAHSIRNFCSWLDKQPAKKKIIIAGNHDKFIEMQNAVARRLLDDHCIYLEDSDTEIDGVKFWGSPITPTFFNWFFMRDRGEAIKRHWDAIPEDTDVLITHGPARGILDATYYANGGLRDHVGCDDLLDAVKRIEPKVHIFGHIHGNTAMRQVGKTLFINAALAGHYNEIEEEPIYFDMSE